MAVARLVEDSRPNLVDGYDQERTALVLLGTMARLTPAAAWPWHQALSIMADAISGVLNRGALKVLAAEVLVDSGSVLAFPGFLAKE